MTRELRLFVFLIWNENLLAVDLKALDSFYSELISFAVCTLLSKKSIDDPFTPRQIYKLIRK
jgi:hypothetical protein